MSDPFPEDSACCATAMRKASRRMTQLYDSAFEPINLRSTQFAILVELDRMPAGPTIFELAQKLVMDRSALGHNLRPLERDGLVTLDEGIVDRRARHVMLTKTGKAKLREALKLWEKSQKQFFSVVGKIEAMDLRSRLLRIAYDERLASLAK